jgi:UDP-4-amino-4-deoxy-L-arabinose-oxoglutarate aminotransferase
MRKEFLPFSRPSITDADVAAVVQVLRSGWITTGPKNAEFEQALCAFTGAAGGVSLASATAGMHVVLKALGVGPGDEVITPSMTWVSTANLVALAGAKPVFVDVDRDTLMTDADRIAAAITGKTRAIIPVHFAGAPADMEPIRRLAAARGIPLVEDAAHALGTSYKGEVVGRRGTAIFSFHPIKNITTGEGGMVTSDDANLLNRLRQLKFHGLGVDAFDRQTHGRAPQAEVLEPGYKYNLTDMAAALGITQLARLPEMNRRRDEIVRLYRQRLSGIPEVLPLSNPPYPHVHSHHLFIVRVNAGNPGIDRDTFMKELKARNIGTGLHFRATHLQKYYMHELGMKRGMLPNTEWNSDRICSLPLFPDMTDGDVEDVVDTIKDVLRRE